MLQSNKAQISHLIFVISGRSFASDETWQYGQNPVESTKDSGYCKFLTIKFFCILIGEYVQILRQDSGEWTFTLFINYLLITGVSY